MSGEKRDVVIFIPARLESSRLHQKLLQEVPTQTGPKSLIKRCYEETKAAAKGKPVVIVVDSNELWLHCKQFAPIVEVVEKTCKNGTERVQELLKREKYKNVTKAVVVIQGDEYHVPEHIIDDMVQRGEEGFEVVTAVKYTSDPVRLKSKHVVKAAYNYITNTLLNLNRKSLPEDTEGAYEHVGMYAYSREALLKESETEDTPLMKERNIEILKFLERGYTIGVVEAVGPIFNINTKEDLKALNNE